MSTDALWSHERSFAARTLNATRTRWFVGRHLLDHDLANLVDDVQLVASELATNAIQHALSPFTVALQGFDDFVFVLVRDGSVVRPRLLTGVAPDAEHGRGMAIVDSLSSDWGVAATA